MTGLHRTVALDVIAAGVQLIGYRILCEAQHTVVNQKKDIIFAQTGNVILTSVEKAQGRMFIEYWLV